MPRTIICLTREGYRLLHGPDAVPPRKRLFSPIGLSRHVHQRAISDFIVHTIRGAHLSGLEFLGYQPENAVRLDAGGETIYPDAAFVIKRGEEQFRFYLEMDCGTERIESEKTDTDSIERKLRTYDAFLNSTPGVRFRVIFVSAHNSLKRLQHILAIADRVKSFAKPPAGLRHHADELPGTPLRRDIAGLFGLRWRAAAAGAGHRGPQSDQHACIAGCTLTVLPSLSCRFSAGILSAELCQQTRSLLRRRRHPGSQLLGLRWDSVSTPGVSGLHRPCLTD